MNELQDAIDYLTMPQLRKSIARESPSSLIAIDRLVDAARRVANPDYEAAARCRWDARFGEGSWDYPDQGPATDEQVQYTHAAFLKSAKRDVDAALGVTEDTE